MSRLSLESTRGREGKFTYGRKDEEYMADFILVSRRVLGEADYRLFRFHLLLGADWRLCCRRLGLERGEFFHALYRIEETLGRVFRELEPYCLFPLDDYYDGPRRETAACRMPPGSERRPASVRGVSPATQLRSA